MKTYTPTYHPKLGERPYVVSKTRKFAFFLNKLQVEKTIHKTHQNRTKFSRVHTKRSARASW